MEPVFLHSLRFLFPGKKLQGGEVPTRTVVHCIKHILHLTLIKVIQFEWTISVHVLFRSFFLLWSNIRLTSDWQVHCFVSLSCWLSSNGLWALDGCQGVQSLNSLNRGTHAPLCVCPGFLTEYLQQCISLSHIETHGVKRGGLTGKKEDWNF